MSSELKSIGRYSIERVLGRGVLGVVYEAVDPTLGRRVAIKAITKSGLNADLARQSAVYYARDAQASGRLAHANIVQVHDCGDNDQFAYLVMEFIAGRALKWILDKGEPLLPGEAVRIVCQVLNGLEYAHRAGIVHRDVKPANIMLADDGGVKLCDFGVARVVDAPEQEEGLMIGTPAYMSPEIILGRPVDGRSDLFSTGIVLYQALTGQRPFEGAGAWAIAKKILEEEPALPSTINAALPREFDAVLQKALAKNPDARFDSARAFSEALQAALDRPATRAIEPYEGEERFIFASYKREDFDRIASVMAQITESGYNVWYDKGIPGSAEWASLLEDKLKRCSMLLFFMSRGSVESKYCRREINYVDSLNKPILCVRLEDAQLKHGLEMLLTQYQMIDAAAENFSGEIGRALRYLRLL